MKKHDINLEANAYYDYSRPNFIMSYSKSLLNLFLWSGMILIISGIFVGLFITDQDSQQGEHYKIIYIHVPSAWISILTYGGMTICSVIFLIWKNILAFFIAKAMARIGAIFTFITLVTGSFWGLPVWGTYWVWDARLTSVLVLFFLYLSYLIFQNAFRTELEGAKASSLLTIIGFINIPIVKFSVDWWSTLHQSSTVSQISSKIDSTMYIPLIFIFFGLLIIEAYTIMLFLRTEIVNKRFEAIQLDRIRAMNL